MNVAQLNRQLPEGDVRLAWELVAKINPLTDVLRRHGLNVTELKQKLRDPMFRSLVQETKKLWESELSTKERIRVKARLLVEDTLLDVYEIAKNDNVGATARLDAFEKLAKVGELTTPEKNAGEAGERVQINITIPGVEQPVIIDSKALPAEESK